jgi:hypothetical protein
MQRRKQTPETGNHHHRRSQLAPPNPLVRDLDGISAGSAKQSNTKLATKIVENY